MTVRLTKAKIRRWDKDLTAAYQKINLVHREVRNHRVVAKGGRYNHLADIDTLLDTSNGWLDKAIDKNISFGEREGVFD